MAQPTLAEQLESAASRIHSLAFDAANERRSHQATEDLLDAIANEGQQLRALGRGASRAA